MANVSLGDILTTGRLLIAEPGTSRFPDSELTNYANLACIQLMLGVQWPEATLSWTSDGVHGGRGNEISLPEIYALLRVYVAGQLCVPTTIPILEGDQIGIMDESTPTYTPQWTAAPFTGYPVAQQLSASSTQALPYFTGQRPQYYTDMGGALGVIPPPTSGSTVAIDVYPAPTPLVNLTDVTFFPQLMKEALAWKTLSYAYFALQTTSDSQKAVECMQNYTQQLRENIIPWKENFNRSLPNQPMPMPHRTFFQGPARTPTGRQSRFGA